MSESIDWNRVVEDLTLEQILFLLIQETTNLEPASVTAEPGPYGGWEWTIRAKTNSPSGGYKVVE